MMGHTYYANHLQKSHTPTQNDPFEISLQTIECTYLCTGTYLAPLSFLFRLTLDFWIQSIYYERPNVCHYL